MGIEGRLDRARKQLERCRICAGRRDGRGLQRRAPCIAERQGAVGRRIARDGLPKRGKREVELGREVLEKGNTVFFYRADGANGSCQEM